MLAAFSLAAFFLLWYKRRRQHDLRSMTSVTRTHGDCRKPGGLRALVSARTSQTRQRPSSFWENHRGKIQERQRLLSGSCLHGQFRLQTVRPDRHARRGGKPPSQPLPPVPAQPARRRAARRSRFRVRKRHGAYQRVGTQRRGMGHRAPLQTLRAPELEPHRSRRQPLKAYVHRREAVGRAAVSPRRAPDACGGQASEGGDAR